MTKTTSNRIKSKKDTPVKANRNVKANAKYQKKTIPKALREQVWLTYAGKRYEKKCTVSWCKNRMTVFDFHVGHNIPESKGGETVISNLLPICSRCNLSMGAKYSITEWEEKYRNKSCLACSIM